MCRPASRNSGSVCVTWIAAFVVAIWLLAGHAQASEPSRSGMYQTTPTPGAADGQLILPQMELDEALQAFERSYRGSPDESFHGLALKDSQQNLIKDLSALNTKVLIASAHTQQNILLSPYIRPAALAPSKLQRWRNRLPPGVKPPAVSYQTFVVSLNGKAYVIAPGHGTRGDKRYYIPPKSDTSVRLATKEEAGYAIPLDRGPKDSLAKILTLEGKFQTGEIVRFQCAGVRGAKILEALLPDVRASFHNRNRDVEVDYARTVIFVLPAEWLYTSRAKVRRISGFSGAPAIEKTPEGDAVAGHFIGHHTVEIDGRKITLGIIEDYEAIRSAVERFAGLPRN
jgi:hypothetical protein